jgi:Ca2+/Na+ antiporter
MSSSTTSGGLFSGISNPLKGNRYIGLFFIVLIVMGGLGLAYYLKIESNRSDFSEYHFRSLDGLEDRFDRLVKNRIEKIEQTTDTAKSSITKSINELLADGLPEIIESLPWEESFEAIVVARSSSRDSAIIFHSLNSNLRLTHVLTANDTINGLEKDVKLVGSEYRLFAKNYKSSHLSDIRVGKKRDSYTFMGLVTSESYDSANLRLDVWLIVLLATVLLLIVIGLPLLKLLFISEIERLFRRDVIMAGISVIIGTPVLFLVFLSIFQYSRDYYFEIPDKLRVLSDSVEQRFRKENAAIVDQLYALRPSFNDLVREDRKVQNSNKFYALDTGVKMSKYSDFKQIARVSASGEITKQLVWGQVVPTNSEKVTNLKERIYFEDWLSGKTSPVKAGDTAYVMRPVLSLETSSEEAIYLLPFEDNKKDSDLMVASVNLASVHQPILPTGYQFAVIDKNGEVWFHSLPGRSTLENFFNSTLDEPYLRSLVGGNIEAAMHLSYKGKKYTGYINPVQGSDLFVIALYDTELLKLQTSEALSLGSMGIVAAFLVTCFLTFVTIYLRRRKSNFFKYKKFPFRFLEPDSDNRMGYATLIVFFSIIIVIIILLVYIKDLAPSWVFMTNMLLMIWAYIFVYYRFNILKKYNAANQSKGLTQYADGQDQSMEAEKKPVDSATGPAQTKKPASASGKERIGEKSLKPGFADFVILAFVVALNALILNEGTGQVGFLIGVQALILLMMFFAIFTVDGLNSTLSFIRVNPDKAVYKRLYIWFLFLWLCLNSILPAFSYFNEASQLERTIWQKKSQLNMAQAFDQKYALLDSTLKFPENVKEARLTDHLKKSVYYVNNSRKSAGAEAHKKIKPELVKVLESDEEKYYHLEKGRFKSLMFYLRPVYDEKISETQPLIFDTSDNARWRWRAGYKQLSFRYRLASLPGKDVEIIYELPARNAPIFLQGAVYGQVIMILLIIGVLLCIFYLVVFFARKIFGFDYSHYKPNDFLNPKNRAQLQQSIGEAGAVSNISVVGLPNSGKMTLAFELLKSAELKKIAIVSCLNIQEVSGKVKMDCQAVTDTLSADGVYSYSPGADLGSKTVADLNTYETIIIENFEHGYQSHSENAKKLKLLKELLDQGKQLVLLTDIYPSQVLSFYRRLIQSSETPNAEHLEHYNAWHNVFGAFTELLHGFNKNAEAINKALNDYEKEAGMEVKFSVRDFIIKELGFGSYLPQLTKSALSLTEKTTYVRVDRASNPQSASSFLGIRKDPREGRISVNSQEFVLQVQSLARGYYANIWNSLATRERYIVYDLAKDGFVNIKNGAALFSLMKKGVVIWKEKPVLFNRSFRNFIISAVSKQEAEEMKQMIRKHGSWGFTKTVLYMVVIGLVGFLMIGEPQFVSDIQTFVGVLAGLATVVPVLSSFISGKASG